MNPTDSYNRQYRLDANENAHRRYNPLTGEWVLVSPHRTQRPWQGQVEKSTAPLRPRYDPNCYLCPGNERAQGNSNPNYESTFVFTNDFAALLPETPLVERRDSPLLRYESEQGTCRVVCFSPRHDLTLAEMSPAEIRQVIEVWSQQTTDLGTKHRWVQIFENKGKTMGCSNPHPHGQIWAGSALPEQPAKEDRNQQTYFNEFNSVLLLDYVKLELEKVERIVIENDNWVVVVPYWAVWPYEILLLPRRHIARLPDLSASDRDDLANVLKSLLVRYDNLFEISFPYSMGWHGAPTGELKGTVEYYWQLHAHFYPPLLRSATVRKFMVGYEMLAEPQRDLTSEQAVERLRSASEVHYASR